MRFYILIPVLLLYSASQAQNIPGIKAKSILMSWSVGDARFKDPGFNSFRSESRFGKQFTVPVNEIDWYGDWSDQSFDLSTIIAQEVNV